MRSLAETIRMRDWWEFKLPPVLALFYGVLLSHGVALLPHVSNAILLLAAIGVCAAFVGILNDVTDIGVDLLAGKPNNMAGRSTAARTVLLAAPALLGLGIAATWRNDLPLAIAYLGGFACFVLYSVPPFRLKDRGLLGVATDAAGAHLFPAFTALFLAFASLGGVFDPLLAGVASVWAFALGLRGILWHQLGDFEADRRAGVATLPQRFTPAALIRLWERAVFPAEVAALLLLLWRMQAGLAAFFLAVHLVVIVVRIRRHLMVPTVVHPRPNTGIVLDDYYGMWLPVAMILQSAFQNPGDLLLLPVYLLLFPGRAWRSSSGFRRMSSATVVRA